MRETRQRGFFGRLLRSIFVIVTGYLALLGLGVTILGVLFGIFIYKHMETGGSFEAGKNAVLVKEPPLDQALLRIKLDRPLTVESLDDTDRLLGQLFNETLPISVDELQLALRRAAEDKRVLGVLLDIDNTGADLSTITSLRRTLEQYTASQKPLYVHLNEGDSSLYYLASVGTKINLAPVSGLTIPGPAFQLTYFGSALERLGLEVEVVRAGRYKSAMEFLIANQPSPETTEMYQSIEGSLRNTLADAISQGRKRSTDEALSWLKRSLFTSQQALTQGLVDRVGYVSDWEEELKTE
ncbi:MAG: S49 family peptidase, partial [Oligoflexus sp.]